MMGLSQPSTATATHPAATLGISDSGVWARIGEIEGYHSQLATALAGLDKGLATTLVRSQVEEHLASHGQRKGPTIPNPLVSTSNASRRDKR